MRKVHIFLENFVNRNVQKAPGSNIQEADIETFIWILRFFFFNYKDLQIAKFGEINTLQSCLFVFSIKQNSELFFPL